MPDLAALPALSAVHARPDSAALIVPTVGHAQMILKADRVIFAPEHSLLIVRGQAYTVPASLFAPLRAALNLSRVGA